MRKWLIIKFLFLFFGINTLNTITYAASPSSKEEVHFFNYVAQPKNTKKVTFQKETIQKAASPRPKNIQRIIPSSRHWHWMTGLAVLLSIAFFACLYSLLFGIPSLLFWIGVFTTPFLAYLFAWLAYKKCENEPERFKGNQFNWFIIAIVTGIIYILMALTTVLVPLLFILSLVYGGGMYMPDLFGLWSMWNNPPKIPLFPKRSKN
jgi:hypothetical protein